MCGRSGRRDPNPGAGLRKGPTDGERGRESGRAQAGHAASPGSPWAPGGRRLDLSGPLLLVVGAEAEGIPRRLLDACDAVTRLPMAGFIASYNLQTAVAAVAMERFRQLEESS